MRMPPISTVISGGVRPISWVRSSISFSVLIRQSFFNQFAIAVMDRLQGLKGLDIGHLPTGIASTGPEQYFDADRVVTPSGALTVAGGYASGVLGRKSAPGTAPASLSSWKSDK